MGVAPARTSILAGALRPGSIPTGAALGAGGQAGAVVEQLAKQLDDERNVNRKRAQEYQDSQQRQAQLVQKLQTKVRAGPWHIPNVPSQHLWDVHFDSPRLSCVRQVLQYKRRCSELESHVQQLEQETGREKMNVCDHVH